MTTQTAFINPLKPTVKIDVVSDVVCPWCYIGKRRLEKAIEKVKDTIDIQLEYHPFELNPDMPKEGRNQREYLAQKFGSEAKYEQLTSHITAVAAEEGLHFDFSKQSTSPNTRDSHRIIWYAQEEGKQPQTKEAFMKAYFEEGVDLSKKENLIAIATKVGLNAKKVEALLSSDQGLVEVEMEEKANYQRGISGVPFYIINNKYGISGAQPADVFIRALTEIGNEVYAQGEACDVDGKNC